MTWSTALQCLTKIQSCGVPSFWSVITIGTLGYTLYNNIHGDFTVYHREHNGSSIFYSKWRFSLRLCWNSQTQSSKFNVLDIFFSWRKYSPSPRQWCCWRWAVWEQRRELSGEWWDWGWWWRLPGLSPSCGPGWLQSPPGRGPTSWRSKTSNQSNTERETCSLLTQTE